MKANHEQFASMLRVRAETTLRDHRSDTHQRHAIHIRHADWWSRAIPLSHGHHSTGYTRIWPGQALLPVESRLEHRILNALSAPSECIALATQPVTIHYETNGTARSYTPDILVAYAARVPRHVECFFIEVKTRQQADRHRFKLQERQRAVIEATALALIVVTDKDLEEAQEVSHEC
jgi:hypothetical protein